MKYFIIVLMFLTSCKILEDDGRKKIDSKNYMLIANFENNIFMFQITSYKSELSLIDNLKIIEIKQGSLLKYLTEKQYEYILKNSVKCRRSNVPEDFSDEYKYINLMIINTNFKYVNESNSHLHNKYSKVENRKIILDNNVSFNLSYDYLGVEIIDPRIL